MANVVIILGETGTGKSTSIKSLNPDETCILEVVQNKMLPFKGCKRMYNSEKKNWFNIDGWQNIITYIKGISDKMPHVKNVIIDDACYIMRNEFFDRAKERGFDKYNDLADHFRQIIYKSTEMRNDMNIFLILHSEPIESDGSIIGYKVSTVGKLLDKMYNPLESVSVALFSKTRFDDKGNPMFGFYTHKRVENGIELPCKSPDGMFEEDFIPNDLQFVVDKMNEYYN